MWVAGFLSLYYILQTLINLDNNIYWRDLLHIKITIRQIDRHDDRLGTSYDY